MYIIAHLSLSIFIYTFIIYIYLFIYETVKLLEQKKRKNFFSFENQLHNGPKEISKEDRVHVRTALLHTRQRVT